MLYNQIIKLKNGMDCHLRNATENDGQAVMDNFNLCHSQTDFLLTYPDENTFDAEKESAFLKEKADSDNEVEIIAVVNSKIAGTAGIEAIGNKYKLRHRAEFGISLLEEFWGLGIGRALLNACIECAKKAGYTQLELTMVAGNERAAELYKSVGFIEFGRNPRGFNSRLTGYQELVYMSLEL